MDQPEEPKILNTDGGAFIAGNVNVESGGMFVGRDYTEIHKITYNVDNLLFGIMTRLGFFRKARLEELSANSKARCLERWRALGVPSKKAETFLELVAANPEQTVRFENEKPVKILVGDFGTGKSLLVEALFQELIRDILRNPNQPIPVLISSEQIGKDLDTDIKMAASLIGDVRKLGAKVIIDGADEISQIKVRKLLQQAVIITKANPKIQIIIASRPLPDFAQYDLEKVTMPELPDANIRAIVEALSEQHEYEYFLQGLPQPILDALKKPFFAILYGLYKQELKQGMVKSQGELITHLVTRAVSEIDDNRIVDLLENLAVLSVERVGKYIPAHDIGSTEEIGLLLKSRFVIRRGNLLGFALPILTQWFAASGLEKNKIPVEQITSSLAQIEKWRYALIVLVSNSSFDTASKFLAPIAELHPGLLPDIVDGAINNHGQLDEEEVGFPPAHQMGERIVQSMQSMVNGLGPLAKSIMPVCNNGKIASIGVCGTGKRLNILWYGNLENEGVIDLPTDFHVRFEKHEYPWHELVSMNAGLQGAWPWIFSLDAARIRLKKFVVLKPILSLDGYLFKEMIRKDSLSIMHLGDLSDDAIPIEALQKEIEKRKDSSLLLPMSEYLQGLQQAGQEYITPLWPGPDLDTSHGGWLWTPYSPERLLERARLVFSVAIEEYIKLVDVLFYPFAECLTTYCTLPAVLTGHLYSEPGMAGPGLEWYFDPLPEGGKSSVNIGRGEVRHQDFKWMEELYLKIRNLRPRAHLKMSVKNQGLDSGFFGSSPVTDIVYDWLLGDLNDISWTKMFP